MFGGLKALSAAAVASAMIAGSAGAATIDILSVSGTWTSVNSLPGTQGLNGLDTNQINFGANAGSGQSGYRFDGIAPTFDLEADELFDVGTFTHFNRPIVSGTSIDGARLVVSTLIDFGEGVQRTLTSVFDFDHWETPNAARPCANGGANGSGVNVNGCADQVRVVTNEGLSESVTVGFLTYFLEITGFNVGADFWTIENLTNSAILQGRFVVRDDTPTTPAPVPLPAAGVLLLAALGGLGVMARRRRT